MDRRMLKQIEDMQKKMVKAQADLANEIVAGTAGGGAVTVEMNGHHEVKSVKIDPDAIDPKDVETLEDMVLTAFNQALEKAQETAQQKMGAITGGLNVPGLF
jgi:DNA-binding YbaB/EbfC family protein